MAKKLKFVCVEISEAFLASIMTIFIILGIALLVIILTPTMFLYRYCLSLIFKWFRPDLDKLLTSGNNVMASPDNIYGTNNNTTVIALRVKGVPEIEEARQITTERIIEAKAQDGKLQYPELKQFPYIWMGYYFWKPADFDIKNHVNYYTIPEQGKIYSDDDIAVIEAELMTKPHMKEQSPWEIIIVPNVKSEQNDPPNSIVFFRTHHGLMDGFAILKLLVGELGGEDLEKLGIIFPEPPKKNFCQNFIYYACLTFRLPYDLAYSAIKRIGLTKNDFRLEHEQLSEHHIGTVPVKVPLRILKEIRVSHKVGLTSVINALLIGAIRRSMVDHNMKIPRKLVFGSPQPLPGHPGKLRVHASAACMLFPIQIQDSIKRLKAIDDFMMYIKRSTETEALVVFKPIIGSFPAPMIDYFMPTDPATGTTNIFPGPSKVFHIFGHEVNGFHFSYGQQKAGATVLFSAMSYAGNVSMKITVNKNRFSSFSDVKKINSYLLEELEALKVQDV